MELDKLVRIISEVGYSSVGDGELMVDGLTKDDFEWLVDQAKKGRYIMIEYRIIDTEELSHLTFLPHINTVAISGMLDKNTAKVYDTNDGIEFTINIKYLVPA